MGEEIANENLITEVIVNASKAVSTLDKVIRKLSELQYIFHVVIPTVSQSSTSLKTVPNNFNFQNIVNETTKISAAFQKMLSQNGISTAKAQSVTAKTVYGTENYAFKSEKLAKSHEKINEVEQKIADSAKWDEDVKKSLNNAAK